MPRGASLTAARLGRAQAQHVVGELVEEQPSQRLRRAGVPGEHRALHRLGQVRQREHRPVEVRDERLEQSPAPGRERLGHVLGHGDGLPVVDGLASEPVKRVTVLPTSTDGPGRRDPAARRSSGSGTARSGVVVPRYGGDQAELLELALRLAEVDAGVVVERDGGRRRRVQGHVHQRPLLDLVPGGGVLSDDRARLGTRGRASLPSPYRRASRPIRQRGLASASVLQ